MLNIRTSQTIPLAYLDELEKRKEQEALARWQQTESGSCDTCRDGQERACYAVPGLMVVVLNSRQQHDSILKLQSTRVPRGSSAAGSHLGAMRS